jgi:hypothetical protein
MAVQSMIILGSAANFAFLTATTVTRTGATIVQWHNGQWHFPIW